MFRLIRAPLRTSLRSFATASPVQNVAKITGPVKGKPPFTLNPPKNVYGEAGSHAANLYHLSKKAKAETATIGKEIESFRKNLKKDPGFLASLEDPRLKKPQRAALIQKKLEPLKFNALTSQFLTDLAVQKGGFDKLKDVSEYFTSLISYDRGEIPVTVRTAEPLTKEQQKKLHNKLKEVVGELTPQVTEKVDPKVIGGLFVTVGDKFQDLTVASKVSQLQAAVEQSA